MCGSGCRTRPIRLLRGSSRQRDIPFFSTTARAIWSGRKGKGQEVDVAELDELTYLLESGSDRIGALDFQRSATEYVPRALTGASLDELLRLVEKVETGVSLTTEPDQAASRQFHRRCSTQSADQ